MGGSDKVMTKLDDSKYIKSLDVSGMLETVEKSASQIVEVLKMDYQISLERRPENIILSGMGGSGIAVNFISEIFSSSLDIPIYVNKGYSVPDWVDDKTLFIGTSYSGDTEETLSSIKEAENRGAKIILVSSGGAVQEIAIAKNYQFVNIKTGLQPRAAFYSIFSTLLLVFQKIGLASNVRNDLEEGIKVIGKLRDEIGVNRSTKSNIAKEIAGKLLNTFPVIFTATGITESIGLRFKNQLNENSKVAGFLSVFPELNHNEIASFSRLQKGRDRFSLVIFRDDLENPRVSKRIETTKSIIGGGFLPTIEIKSEGVSRIAKAFSMVYMGDMVSVYLGILNNVDPSDVDIIYKFKKELAR